MDPSLRTLIEQAEFKESFRGYDRAQVDDTLEQLANRAGKLESELADASRRLAEMEARGPATAGSQAAPASASAPAPAAAPVRDEQADAEEVRLTLVMAQRTADAAIAEAKVKAEQLLDAARTDAMRTTADARSESTRERQEGRKLLASEIEDLASVRTVLQGDIAVMERHVKTEREQLSAAIERLRELLRDPSAFRTSPPPAVTPVTIPPTPAATESDGAASATAAPTGATASPSDNGDTTPAATAPPSATPKAPEQPAASAGNRPTGRSDSGTPVGSAKAAKQSAAPAVEEDAFLSELRKAMNDEESGGSNARPAAGQAADQPTARSAGPEATDRKRYGRRN